MTKRFSGVEVRVSRLECCRVEWVRQDKEWKIKELPGTDFILPADMVILALGFEYVVYNGLIKNLGLRLDECGNVAVDNYQTSEPWVFAAGNTVNGASLVVRAIHSGRKAAAAINRWLQSN